MNIVRNVVKLLLLMSPLVVLVWIAHQISLLVDERNALLEDLARVTASLEENRSDLHNAAIAVAAVKAKIDHQARRDTVAITAEYHLDYTFDLADEQEDMRFHSFCDEHVNDALWFSDREALALREERAKLMGYNGAPDKKGGFVMECRWSVMANRNDWCRNSYAP